MRLKSVKLTHFRGYRTTTVIPIDEAMTGIVGRNDYGKSTLQSMCKSIVGMANINAQEMQNIQILLPPIEIQNKYAAIFQTTKQRLRSQSQSEGNLADLFSALSQKAFRGEC